jgi:RNA ligase (TIGR02306 family)
MKNASIEKIIDILPIPNSDRIELCKVLGWQSVVKKGEYQIGDNVVFVPIDTVLPDTEWTSFLKDAKNPSKPIVLKMVKMRGVLSCGVVFPMSILPQGDYKEGDDVAEILGITHYEKPAPVNQDAIGGFPNQYVRITDEDNMLSNPETFNELKAFDGLLEITLKMDGTSFSCITPLGENSKVCSRRQELKEGGNPYWNMAKKYNLVNTFDGLAIQGEICGGSIQGNKIGLSQVDLYIFNIKDLNYNITYSPNELNDFCENHDLKKVPVVKIIHSNDLTSVEMLQEIANSATYQNGQPAEGIVVRPMATTFSNTLQKELSVKVLNQNYKD